MKMKFGAIVVDGRNKIGGHVASKNRAGAYLRTKVTPVNRRTLAQTGVRSRLTTISKAWKTLTQANRDSWNSAVSSYKKTDIFGDIHNPTGFNLYQKLNNNILSLGGALASTPPIIAKLDAASAPVLTYTVGVPALSLAVTAATGVDHGFKIFATAPQSPGKGFVKSEYRQITALSTTIVAANNILAAYTAVFGSLGSIGQKIFVKIVPVGSVSGLQGLAVATSAISAA